MEREWESSTDENPIIRKMQNTKCSSKKFPSNLTRNIQDTKTIIESAARQWSSQNSFYRITWTFVALLSFLSVTNIFLRMGITFTRLYGRFREGGANYVHLLSKFCPRIRKFQGTKSPPPERINFVPRGITVSSRRAPRGLFWTSVRGVALEKE